MGDFSSDNFLWVDGNNLTIKNKNWATSMIKQKCILFRILQHKFLKPAKKGIVNIKYENKASDLKREN